MCANASAARWRRWSRVKPPSASAASTSAYLDGLMMTATEPWFLAAARTIEGPPMSICSTHCSGEAPDATVAWNGYRFTTTSWNGSMPSSASCASCAGLAVSASRPACTLGCSVLTRPSRHSGKPVSSSTRGDGHPGGRDPGRGTAGGDDLDAGRVQPGRQVLQPGLVVDADQRPPDRDPGHSISSHVRARMALTGRSSPSCRGRTSLRGPSCPPCRRAATARPP